MTNVPTGFAHVSSTVVVPVVVATRLVGAAGIADNTVSVRALLVFTWPFASVAVTVIV
ncbi:MAG: hypothetical protein ACREEL_15075 [Stellaceae bacterium]